MTTYRQPEAADTFILDKHAIAAGMQELLDNINYRGGQPGEILRDAYLASRQTIFTTAMEHLFGVEDAQNLANGCNVSVLDRNGIETAVSEFHMPRIIPGKPLSFAEFQRRLQTLPNMVFARCGAGSDGLKRYVGDIAFNIEDAVQRAALNPPHRGI